MPLPILKVTTAVTPESLVRAWLQTEQVLSQALIEPLDCNGAQLYCDPALHDLPEANRVVDAFATDSASIENLLATVDALFAERATRCREWVINPTLEPKLLDYLRTELFSRSYREHSIDLWVRTQPPAKLKTAELPIVPARACYSETAELFAADPGRSGAMSRWLDEPRIDSLIALRDRKAVGHVSALSLGQIGRIQHLFVAETERRRGVGGQLLLRALEICSRSLFQHVFASVDGAESKLLLQRAGFTPFAHASVFRI